jgi:hypothetical protein
VAGRLSKPAVWVLIALGAFVINLPMAHSGWYEWRLDRDGVDTEATIVETRRVPPEGDNATHVVEFRFDRELDPSQELWFATVDEDTWDRARADGRIGVRMLPDRPATQEVDGQDTSSLPWVITVLGDAMLLGIALLYWRAGPPAVAQLRLVATADVERCRPQSSLELLDDGSYVVCGDVTGIEDDAIVLDLGDQTVRVELDGHANPVGYQQPARVTGRP